MKSKVAEPVATNVVNLMDALRRSVAGAGGAKAAPAPKPAKGKKRIAGQREMLLPISGKGTREVKPAKDVREAKGPRDAKEARPAAKRAARR